MITAPPRGPTLRQAPPGCVWIPHLALMSGASALNMSTMAPTLSLKLVNTITRPGAWAPWLDHPRQIPLAHVGSLGEVLSRVEAP